MKSRLVLGWMTLLMIVALVVPSQLPFVARALRSAPVMFIENVGQFPDGARFQVWGGPATVWLAEDAVWFTIVERGPIDTEAEREDEPLRGVNLKLSFPGANPHPRLQPFDRLDTVVSYFTGSDPDQWRSAVPVWGGVRYLDLYPGVDLVVGATLPWRLEVHDDADLSAVRLLVEGADAVALGSGQYLRLTTALGDFTLPLLTVEGGQSSPRGVSPARIFDIDGTFEVAYPFSASTPNSQPFDWVQGRSATPNLLSPDDLIYSTFVGGSGDDQGQALALDGDYAVIAGSTSSLDFPTVAGAYGYNGGGDVFVLKLKLDGSLPLYSTFVGGSGDDWGYALALDGDNVVVAGGTRSSDFPTNGAYDASSNGGMDVFVLKLAANGSSLEYSTFVGGSGDDQGLALALDGVGNAVVTGSTKSSGFPTTNGAYDPDHNDNKDVFVLKLNLSAVGEASLLYSTFVGGSANDEGLALALDSVGNVVVTGQTYSDDFPTTDGAYETTLKGVQDVFVLKLDLAVAGEASLLYSTFVGGSGDDQGLALALDDDDNAVVAGGTKSFNFPTTDGAYDTIYNGSWDVFVLKLAANGSSLDYSTFVGGSNWDKGFALALDSEGNAVVTGETWYSDDVPFPITSGAYDTIHNGNYDVFVLELKLAADGDPLSYSTFVGGSEDDQGRALALDGEGYAVVTGQTQSSDFPTVAGAYGHNGGGDVFVLKLDGDIPPTPTPTNTPTDTPTPTNTPGTPTVTPTYTPTDTPTPTPTDTPTHTPTPTDTPTPTPTPTYTPTPTPTNTPTPTPTYTPTPTPTPTYTPTPTPTPTPITVGYCCSPGDSIYRLDESSFYGYTTKSAVDSSLIHVTSPPAPWGWNQPYGRPDSSWQSAIKVWWDDWKAPNWNALPGDNKCWPIGLQQDEDGNQEAQSGITHLYWREFTLSPPLPGMEVDEAFLEMWSDNKTEWWWEGTPVMYSKEGYIGKIDLFPRLIRPDGGIYVLAFQNSNDRVSRDYNPQGTACNLSITWAFPREPSRIYLPLILKNQP